MIAWRASAVMESRLFFCCVHLANEIYPRRYILALILLLRNILVNLPNPFPVPRQSSPELILLPQRLDPPIPPPLIIVAHPVEITEHLARIHITHHSAQTLRLPWDVHLIPAAQNHSDRCNQHETEDCERHVGGDEELHPGLPRCEWHAADDDAEGFA